MATAKKAAPKKAVKKAATKKAATTKKVTPKAPPAEKAEKKVRVPKEMTPEELKEYVETKGIKTGGLSLEKLKIAANIPEIDEEVSLVKKKDEKPMKAVYKGFFKCPKTSVFYAKLVVGGKKKMIKQLAKIERA